MKCNNCELCKATNNNFIIGRGSKSAKIMVIQDCISELDLRKGKQFYGKNCTQFVKSLEKRGFSTKDLYFTSLVKGYVAEDKITNEHIKHCNYILESEIEVIDPNIIVPLGKHSLKYLIGKNAISKLRGRGQKAEVCGKERIILPILHPNTVDRKPGNIELILNDLNTLKDLYENNDIQCLNDTHYTYLETLEDCVAEINRLKSAKVLSFDLETTGNSPFRAWSKIVCIALSDRPHYGTVIPLHKKDSPISAEDTEYIIKLLKDLLEDSSIPKVAHNGKFDILWLYKCLNIDVKNFYFDTMLAHYICISEESGTQSLKYQAWEFTDMGGYDNALDEYRNKLPDNQEENGRWNYDNIPWNVLKTYACCDVDCTLRLKEIYEPLINNNKKWKVLFHEILMPASYTLRDIELNGMKFNDTLAQKYSTEYGKEIKRIQSRLESYPEVLEIERDRRNLYLEREQIKKIPKKDRTEEENFKFAKYKAFENFKFNWNSTSQLNELLFNKLKLVTTIKTQKGTPSTNKEAMEEMKKQHEIPELLLELRKVTTLNNFFIQKLPYLNDSNNVIHPSFNLIGTLTGRMSSDNPNAQQLPRKAENPLLFQYHNEPKALFTSRFGEDGCILNADYSALEIRISGIISNDIELRKALLSGKDLHKSTASLVWGVPIEEVSKDMRTNAKSVNFGIIYGKSGITFAQDLFYDPSGKNPKKTSNWEKAKEEGLKLVKDYLQTFSGLNKWLNNTKEFAKKNGYVETMFGRRRRLPDLKSKVPAVQSVAERQSINAPIQGTGADFTLLSLIQLNNWLKSSNKKSCIVCTVHDSIVFDIYIPELKEVSKKIKGIMEHVHEPYINTDVPIVSDIEMGYNYGSVFETSLEEIESINTKEDFKNWDHEKRLNKYQNEVKTLINKGFNKEQIINFLELHNRPIDQLQSLFT